MEKLYISFNKINGTLPKNIGQLSDLREFYAYTNEMTGELPSELGNLVYIENLVLGKNHFEGQFSVAIEQYFDLRIHLFPITCSSTPAFVLLKQHKTGNLPIQLNNLVSLKEFSVYSNEDLTGQILDFSKVSKIEKLE